MGFFKELHFLYYFCTFSSNFLVNLATKFYITILTCQVLLLFWFSNIIQYVRGKEKMVKNLVNTLFQRIVPLISKYLYIDCKIRPHLDRHEIK